MSPAVTTLLADVRLIANSSCLGCERNIPHICQRELARQAVARYERASGKKPTDPGRRSKLPRCPSYPCPRPMDCELAQQCLALDRGEGAST